MTDMLEIAEWLTRFEKRFGINETRESLDIFQHARDMFYEELGYNMTRKQFENLRTEKNERIQVELNSSVKPMLTVRHTKQGIVYKVKVFLNILGGKFAKNPFTKISDNKIPEIIQENKKERRLKRKKRGYENRKGN